MNTDRRKGAVHRFPDLAGLDGFRLEAGPIEFRLEYVPRVRSTQEALEVRLDQGALVEGTVLIAEEQTAGKGRHGRSWISPPGCNLYFSIHGRMELSPAQSFRHLYAVAAAVHETVSRHHPDGDVWIKWPNDIWWGEHKLAGILVNGYGGADGGMELITGVGINLNADRDQLPPEGTSIWIETHRRTDRARFLLELLTMIGESEPEWLTEEWETLKRRWKRLAGFSRWRKVIRTNRGRREELVPLDIGDRGELLVRNEEGAVLALVQTDPSLRVIRGV